MNTVKDNLIAARALIDTPEKWVKGSYMSSEGCFCALGSIRAVVGDGDGDWTPEAKSLKDALPDDFTMVHTFNDDSSTAHKDILDLFDRAIAAQGDA